MTRGQASRFTAAILALAILAAVVAGCGSSSSSSSSSGSSTGGTTTSSKATIVSYSGTESSLPTEYPEPEKGSLTIGFLNPTSAQEGLKAIQTAITEEAGSYGAKVVSLDANLDVDQQVSQMQTLIDQKVDAIIVYPLDPGALAPIIARAKAAGIPVIGVQSTLTPAENVSGLVSQVWLGPDKNAYSIAKAIAEKTPEANLGLIGFAAPVPYIKLIVERVGYWGKKMGLNILGEEDNKDDSVPGGEAAATGLLGRYPEMNAIFTYNETSALGAYTAVRSTGRQDDVTIYSNNGTTEGIDAVGEGKIAVTFQFPFIATGELAVQAALDAANEVKIPPVVTVPESKEITAENVDEATSWEQQLKEKEGN
jgi:ABC-type sugar transport system substrate-binding protein